MQRILEVLQAVTRLRQEMAEQFAAVTKRLDRLDVHMVAVEDEIAVVSALLRRLEHQMERHDRRLTAVEDRPDA
jgi:septal ring factor EnvC (AmiA/AmiB activator)